MKRMINAHLAWFLEFNGLLSNIQYGLRQDRNTLDHLVRFETRVFGIGITLTNDMQYRVPYSTNF
jgi:hypothetical protein